jgi:hypothetical protein
MAALGLDLFAISPPVTGHPVPPVPAAGFHDVFALTTGLARRGAGRQSATPSPASPNELTR